MKALVSLFWAATLFAASPERTANPEISLIRVPNGGIQPQATIDRAGLLHLLYYSGGSAHGDLFYVTSSTAGRTWSSALRVNSDAGSATAAGTIRGGQIAVGRNGRVHIAWNGSSKAAPMLYSRLNSSHTAFEPERNLMTRTFGLDGGGTVAADGAGHVYVTWHGKGAHAAPGEAGRQVWIARSEDDGNTFTTEQPVLKEATGACGCCGMAMHADSKGIVRVLYRSATENVHRDIYVLTSRDYGKTFDARKLHAWQVNACPLSSMAFSESAGKIEAAWETDGQVFFEDLTAGDGAPVSAPGESKGHKHPRIAENSAGNTLMAWTEGTGWARGGSLAWQLYDATGTATEFKGAAPGVPAWSFAAVVAKPSGFIILY